MATAERDAAVLVSFAKVMRFDSIARAADEAGIAVGL